MNSTMTFSDALESWFRITLGRGMRFAHEGAMQIEIEETDGAFWPWGYSDIAGWQPIDDTFQFQNDTVASSQFVWGMGSIINADIAHGLGVFNIGQEFSFRIYLVDFVKNGKTVRGIDLENSIISLWPTVNAKILNADILNEELAGTIEMEKIKFLSLL